MLCLPSTHHLAWKTPMGSGSISKIILEELISSNSVSASVGMVITKVGSRTYNDKYNNNNNNDSNNNDNNNNNNNNDDDDDDDDDEDDDEDDNVSFL